MRRAATRRRAPRGGDERGPCRTHTPARPFTLALMQHDAGNRERAFAWMEQALEDGDPNLHTMGILMPDLKGDPRFRSLMQRMGLPY